MFIGVIYVPDRDIPLYTLIIVEDEGTPPCSTTICPFPISKQNERCNRKPGKI